MSGKFQKEHRQVKRTRQVITREYFEKVENNWPNNGLLFEVDQAATDQYYIDCKAQNEARKEADELQNNAAFALANAVKGITAQAKPVAKTPKPEKKETPPEETGGSNDVDETIPTMDWTKSNIITWLNEQENTPEFEPSLNKSDLMAIVNELLTKNV